MFATESVKGSGVTNQQPYHRHVVIYGLGAIALHVANLALLPLYTHFLTTAEYGVLQIIYRIGEVFHVCLMVQAVRLATFNLAGTAKDEAARSRTAASVAAVTTLSIIIGGLLIVFVGNSVVGRFDALGSHRLVCLGVCTVMLQALTVMPIAMMQSRFESVPYVCATLGMAICHVAIVSFAVAILGWGVWGVILSLAVTHGTFGTILTLRELMRSSFRPDKEQMVHFVRFSAPMVPVGILSILMHNGDQFFLLSSHGAAAVGVYALGYRLTQALEMFAVEPLCQVWHPWIYRVFNRDDGPAALGRAVTGILGVYLFCGLGLVVLRFELISLLSTSPFWEAADLIPTLVLAFFFVAASSLTDASFFVTGRTAMRTPIAMISTLLMLVLYWVLIPRFGGQGAAYATLLGFAANYGLTLLIAQRIYRIQYERARLAIFVLTALATAIVASYLGVGASWVIPKLILWLGWPTMLWMSGLIRASEKAWLQSFVRSAWSFRQRASRIDAATK